MPQYLLIGAEQGVPFISGATAPPPTGQATSIGSIFRCLKGVVSKSNLDSFIRELETLLVHWCDCNDRPSILFAHESAYSVDRFDGRVSMASIVH